MGGGRGRGLSSWPDSSRRLRDSLFSSYSDLVRSPFCIPRFPVNCCVPWNFWTGRGEGLKEKLHFRKSFNRGERAWDVLFKKRIGGSWYYILHGISPNWYPVLNEMVWMRNGLRDFSVSKSDVFCPDEKEYFLIFVNELSWRVFTFIPIRLRLKLINL